MKKTKTSIVHLWVKQERGQMTGTSGELSLRAEQHDQTVKVRRQARCEVRCRAQKMCVGSPQVLPSSPTVHKRPHLVHWTLSMAQRYEGN